MKKRNYVSKQIKSCKQKYLAKNKKLTSGSSSMPNPKFEDNIQIIDRGSQQFESFLSRFRARSEKGHANRRELQQNMHNSESFEKSESNHDRQIHFASSVDFYENKIEYRYPISNAKISPFVSSDSENLQKFKKNNPSGSPTKTPEQDNIKNSHPGQYIILKSAQQLPHWLFEHIRKKNVNKLKNICIDEDKQRHSQIMESSQGENEYEGEFGKARTRMAQRYLNQSYMARKQKEHMNPQTSRHQMSGLKNVQNSYHHEKHNLRKVSSSFEMSHLQKSTRLQSPKRTQRNNQIYINDYEYSYCPDADTEQQKRSYKSASHRSAVFEEVSLGKLDSAKKPKSRKYRIRLEEKVDKMSPVPRAAVRRLPTVSEEEPLGEPKKFVLC